MAGGARDRLRSRAEVRLHQGRPGVGLGLDRVPGPALAHGEHRGAVSHPALGVVAGDGAQGGDPDPPRTEALADPGEAEVAGERMYPPLVPTTALRVCPSAGSSQSTQGWLVADLSPWCESLVTSIAPSGISGAPPVGTTWEVPLDELFVITVPTYRWFPDGPDDPVDPHGYQFSFTVTATPEPAGLVLFGTIMLAGLRRRGL